MFAKDVTSAVSYASAECKLAAEFDSFGSGYTAGMENGIKRLVGRSADDFIVPKVQWLLRDLDRRPVTASTREAERQVRLLDLGCGTGRLLWHLQQTEFSGKLCGCDVSAGMLAELRRTWVAGVLPEVRLLDRETVLPFGDGEFDVVVLSAVVHHVLPAQRPKLLQETWRVLAPGGRAVIFEHNIYHPLTRWVVARTAIDRHAVLVSPRALCAALRAAGFSDVMTRYLLFLPPRWRWTLLVDDWLGWLPAGGQYVVTGDKA